MTVHTENEALFQRASRCLAGGVLSNFKKAKGVAPVYVKSAEAVSYTHLDVYKRQGDAPACGTPYVLCDLNFRLPKVYQKRAAGA